MILHDFCQHWAYSSQVSLVNHSRCFLFGYVSYAKPPSKESSVLCSSLLFSFPLSCSSSANMNSLHLRYSLLLRCRGKDEFESVPTKKTLQNNCTFYCCACARVHAHVASSFNGLQQPNRNRKWKETNKIAERPQSSLMVLTILFVFKAIFVKQFGFRSRIFAQRF